MKMSAANFPLRFLHVGPAVLVVYAPNLFQVVLLREIYFLR